MAIENNDILYDVDIDLQDSLREIDRLQKKLSSFESDLGANVTQIQQRMRNAANEYVSYIRKLEGEIKSLRSTGKDSSAHEARLSQIQNRQRSAPSQVAAHVAQGSEASMAGRAVLQREINEMRSTSKQLMGKYFDELNSSHLREVKRSLTDLRTEEKLLRERMSDRNMRAEMGDASFGFMKQRERRDLNGGADQFRSQMGILNNYMMVGGMYGGGFYLGNFIAQLDKEFKQFQAITDTTNTEMARMEERLLSVSETTKFTAVEIAEAATLMGQAGMSAAEVGEAIKPVAMLATAAGTDLKEAVDVVTSALNIFNLQTSEAGHLSDVFTAALNESKLTLNQLTLALQYAGNIAATAGVSYNELTAAVGALANAGIRSGSTIGTGLRQLLVDLISPSKNLKAELDRLGLTMADINIETNGLTGVMMNLREAGFDTESAFGAFEVRAAAAFTALSNNVDTLANLRQSFILTNAAAEANKTQMESLINTAKNFGSALGGLSYTAFKPFIDGLQDIFAGVTDVLVAIRNLGPIVSIVGTAFASLVSAAIIVKLGRLAAGLLGFGTAAKGAAAGVGILNLAMRANPVIMGITALATGITLLRQYGDTTGRVSAQLDQLEASQNGYQAQVDRTIDRVASLDDAIDDLIQKQATLEKAGNENLRKTKVMEVVSGFEELALSVDSSTASISDLIDAMKELKGEMIADLPEQFDLLVAQIDQRIQTLQGVIQSQARSESWFTATDAVSGRFGNGGGLMPSQTDDYNEEIKSTFGPEILEIFRLASNQQDTEGYNGLRAKSLMAFLETQITRAETQVKPLEDRNGVWGMGSDLSVAEDVERRRLNDNIEFFKQLKTAFDPLASYIIELRKLDNDRELAVNNQASAAFRDTKAYSRASDLEDEATAFLTERLTEIARSGIMEDPIAANEAFKELEIALQGRISDIEDQLDNAAEEMRTTTNFTEDQIESALHGTPLQTELAQLKSALKKGAENANEEFVVLQEYLLEGQQKTLERKINGVKRELGDTQDERRVEILTDRLYALDNQLASVETELFKLDPDDRFSNSGTALEIARRRLEDDQKTRREDLGRMIVDKYQEITEQANEVYTDRLETKLEGVQNEMDNLVDTIDENSTADAIKAVRDKLEELDRKAKELAGQIASVRVSDDYGNFTVGGLPTESATDIQRKIINAANDEGIPAQIALAIASFESGFKPTADNPHSSAYGLFQNTKDNWIGHGLRMQDRDNVNSQIYAGIKDMRRTADMFGTPNLSFQDYYGAHLLGQAGYRKVRNNPNARAVDLLGADAVRGNGGHPDMTAEEFAAYVTAKASKHLALVEDLVQRPMDAAASALEGEVDKLTERNRDAVREATDIDVDASTKRAIDLLDEGAKRIEAEINTLMVQSSKVKDPAALQSIIDQVRTKWTEMMEKEVEAFEIDNPGVATDDLTAQLEAGLTRKITTLLDRYQSSIENLEFAPLQRAEAQLSAAQNPLNAHKFTDNEVADLQRNVQLQQRAAQQEKLNQLTQLHTYILQEVAAAEQKYGANSQMVQAIKERQYSVEQSLGGVRRQVTADTEAAARSEISLKQAIDAANAAWMQRNGLMTADGRMVSTAERVGKAWGQMLDGLTNGFSQLFMDLASGTMDAEEAFKKFALSVIQMLMQMIAKQMAFNIIAGLTGGGKDPWSGMRGTGSGGGNFLSSIVGAIFGGGAATGQYVSGIKRSANGEYVAGQSPFRDSEFREVMPGEMILRTSAVNQIGRDALEKVNALGNRKMSKGMPALPEPQRPDSRPINIWAVLPEEQQQIGPNDVVAFISDDIRRRGQTRTLIKAVNSGKL